VIAKGHNPEQLYQPTFVRHTLNSIRVVRQRGLEGARDSFGQDFSAREISDLALKQGFSSKTLCLALPGQTTIVPRLAARAWRQKERLVTRYASLCRVAVSACEENSI
jgi:hypothetical protein